MYLSRRRDMRAGRLDRMITIQRRSVTVSDAGGEIETWTTIVSHRPAAIWTAQTGDETFNPRQPQLVAVEKVEWMIRYSADVASLSPLDRIVYPALSEIFEDSPEDSPEEVPDDRTIYDILAVHEYGRHEGLRVTTVRRPDSL